MSPRIPWYICVVHSRCYEDGMSLMIKSVFCDGSVVSSGVRFHLQNLNILQLVIKNLMLESCFYTAVWYFRLWRANQENHSDNTSLRCFAHEWHPIARPHKQAMGCLSGVLWQKITDILRTYYIGFVLYGVAAVDFDLHLPMLCCAAAFLMTSCCGNTFLVTGTVLGGFKGQ